MTTATSVKVQPARFEDGGTLRIAGPVVRYSMKEHAGIPGQWERFRPHIGRVPGQVGAATYGLSLRPDGGGQDSFDYVTGVEVGGFDGLPADWAHVTLPPQRYAVFPHRDHISTFQRTIDAIFNGWLPTSGFRMAGGTSRLTLLERYASFDAEKGTGDIEVWIPVEKA